MDVSLRENFQKAIDQVDGVVLGKRDQVEKMFIALLCGGHVLLDDTPGMGKTTLARALSSVLGMTLHRVQFTSDLMPADLTGINVGVSTEQSLMQFQPGPLFANMVLADEINRASPRTQSALLEAMAERQVTIDGVSHKLPNPFWVVATQNPVDLSGTFPLPDSQMDRFLFRMEMGYPSSENEINLMMGQGGDPDVLSPVLHAQDVLRAQNIVESMSISRTLAEYVYALVESSRRQPKVLSGISPRGSLAIIRAAKARAWLKGREFPLPEDVQDIFFECASHRISIPYGGIENKKDVVSQIIQQVDIVRK